jgi:hypothetical protein
VVPKIFPDGRVQLRVTPQISSVDNPAFPVGNGGSAPSFNQQVIDTTVSVRDGETVVVGGLITRMDTKNENKVPWFGDLPVVGSLFRFRSQVKAKRELLVILTPRIVRCRADADKIMAEEGARMDWILGDVVRTHGSTGMLPLFSPPPLPPPGPPPPGGETPPGGFLPFGPGAVPPAVAPVLPPDAPPVPALPSPVNNALPAPRPAPGNALPPPRSEGPTTTPAVPAPTTGAALPPTPAPVAGQAPVAGPTPERPLQGLSVLPGRGVNLPPATAETPPPVINAPAAAPPAR